MSAHVHMDRQRKGEIPQWVSWLIYALLSLAMTWPLALHLNTHLHGNNQDIFNVYWGNWWVSKALAAGQNPYVTDYLIYPVGFDLTTFAFSPFLALLSLPLTWIMSPIAAYNLTVWATIVLCCVAMDSLVRYLTRSSWAALVAGITFGFAPCLAAMRLARLNMAMVAWIPWTALLITRLMREARARDAVLLAVTVGLSTLTRLQTGALVLLFCGVYLIGLTLTERRQWHRRAGRKLLLAGLLSCLFLSPFLVHVLQILSQPGGENLLGTGNDTNPTDLLSYVVPLPQHPLLGSWTDGLYQQRLPKNITLWTFVGFVPLLLFLYAAASRPRAALPWLMSGVFFLVLALGPYLRVNGRAYPEYKLPYYAVQRLLGVVGLEKPNRFNLAMMSALAPLVGLASAQLCAQLGRSWPLSILAALTLFEYLAVPMPLIELPPHSPFYAQIAADGEDYAIVDLPLTREEGEIHRYYQTYHHKRIVGGWDHRVPPSAFAFIGQNPLLRAWRDGLPHKVALGPALAELSKANVRYIVLHKDQLKSIPPGFEDLLLALTPVWEDRSLYVLPTEAKLGQEDNVYHPCAVLSPLEGCAFPVALNAPMGVLEYDVAGYEDALRMSLSWRSLSDPDQPYVLSAQLLDLSARRAGALGQGAAGESSWTDVGVREREIHITDDVPQGEYRLGISVHFPGDAGGDRPAPERSSSEQWSEHRFVLDVPIVVLPATFKDVPVSKEGRVVIFAAAMDGVPAEPQYSADVRFGDVTKLTGYSLGQQEIIAGEELDLILYWEAINAEPTSKDYKVFTHLLNGAGEIIAQHDGEPVAGRRPTHTWKRGDMIVDTHRLTWQTQDYAGTATLAVGLYDFQSNERLPASGSGGERFPHDRVFLGQVEVE